MSKKEVYRRLRALYIRVSTEAQAEEGYSIQAQIERLEAYCKAMGWDDFELYIDGGFSGSNLNRPRMQELIADVEAGKIETVVVFKLDRLSRSQKDTLFLIEDVFIPNGVAFVSLNESIDTSTPYGRAMIGILSAFAQLERENIYLRTRMGMVERVKQGYWMGGGRIPFGYTYDRNTGTLIPHPEEAKLVRKMYDLYLKGYSCQAIANMLDVKYDRLVSQILQRKSNLGMICYKGEEYRGLHEAIVSEEIFNLTQLKMAERSKKHRVTTRKHHLLTGLVYCGECGARMRYVSWGKTGYKLRCYSRDSSKQYMHKSDHCEADAVWADQIEKIVLEDLFNISANMENSDGFSNREVVDPLLELEGRIEQLEAKIKRLYNLYAEAGNDVLLETIDENNRQLILLKEQYALEEESRVGTKHLDFIREQVASIRDTWDFLTEQEKQMVIRDCVDHINISDDKVEIYYTFIKKEGADTKIA